jgi:Holliday junction DNA helicase RuvA
MIGRLKGKILEKQAPHLLIDVSGVAYEVQAPMTSFYPLPNLGEEVIMHTHLSVSENAHQLFAFYTKDERQLFRTLIKVNGVGPKMALGILSGMPVEEFIHCVSSDNVSALVKVPGVGKKTAERLIIEVKDRLKDLDIAETSSIIEDKPQNNFQSSNAISAEAESALVALGYKPTEAAKMISSVRVTDGEQNSEELIRLALKSIAG